MTGKNVEPAVPHAELLTQVLKQCGDNLTRDNVMNLYGLK